MCDVIFKNNLIYHIYKHRLKRINILILYYKYLKKNKLLQIYEYYKMSLVIEAYSSSSFFSTQIAIRIQ